MTYTDQAKRYAEILSDAESMGDDAAAKAHGIGARQLANIRNRALTSPEIQEALAERQGEPVEASKGALTITGIRETMSRAKAFLDRSMSPGGLDPSKARDVEAVHQTIGLMANLEQALAMNERAAARFVTAVIEPQEPMAELPEHSEEPDSFSPQDIEDNQPHEDE